MTTDRNAFLAGMRAGLPFVLVIVPFGLLFGVVSAEAGLSVVQAMAMTALVIAGASQFAAVQLLADNAPVAVIVLTGLAVNLRMAMYSASMAPHVGHLPLSWRAVMAYFLVDQTYGVVFQKMERDPGRPGVRYFFYFLGSALTICPLWYIASYVGFVAGTAIPESLAIDFGLPVTFIALFAPSLRSLPHVGAAAVAAGLALALAWMPLNGGMLLAALAGMVTGAVLEWRLERAKAVRA